MYLNNIGISLSTLCKCILLLLSKMIFKTETICLTQLLNQPAKSCAALRVIDELCVNMDMTSHTIRLRTLRAPNFFASDFASEATLSKSFVIFECKEIKNVKDPRKPTTWCTLPCLCPMVVSINHMCVILYYIYNLLLINISQQL